MRETGVRESRQEKKIGGRSIMASKIERALLIGAPDDVVARGRMHAREETYRHTHIARQTRKSRKGIDLER